MINKSGVKGGKRVSPERLDQLVTRLRTGDRTVAEEIIKGHIGMAVSVARRYTSSGSERADDLIGAAMFGLVQAVEWGARGKLRDNNITPYIYCTVRRFVMEYLQDDHIVRIPVRQYRKMKEAKTVPIVQTIDLRHDEDNQDYDSYDQYVELLSTNDEYEIIFMEIIDSLKFDSREREIIDCLNEGYTHQEIAEKLGTTHQNISRLRNIIKERMVSSDLCN